MADSIDPVSGEPFFTAGAPPRRVTVVVEVTRGSFLKRSGTGAVEYVSPVPCPFNYGSVPGTLAPDGDAVDALVLGPGLPRGASVEALVFGVVRFLDAGEADDKLVCAAQEPDADARELVRRFFTFYTFVKRGVNVVRRKRGATRFTGVEWNTELGAPGG